MPRTFKELIGQEEAARHLQSLCDSDRVPHAMLFEGPENVGKRTAAMILAQVLLCTERDRAPGTACGACSGCVKVEGGNHGDLHLVTTDTRMIKIAEIRAVERILQLRPVEGTRKLLIIDDAHRMNVQSQNALLKTLEEPPGAAHIVLTTTRLRAILPTVVSRCQRLAFRPIPRARIADIVAEKRELDAERAGLVAALAQGSLARAMELDLEELLPRRDRIAELDRVLAERSAQSALAALDAAGELSDDREVMIATLELWSTWLHDQMIVASGASTDQISNVDRLEDVGQLAHARGLLRVLDRIKNVLEARRQLEMPFNFNPQMVAEQLCLALAGHGRMEAIDRP